MRACRRIDINSSYNKAQHTAQPSTCNYISGIMYTHIDLRKCNGGSPKNKRGDKPAILAKNNRNKRSQAEVISSMIGRETKSTAALIYEQPCSWLQMTGAEAMHTPLDSIGCLIAAQDGKTRTDDDQQALHLILIE